MKNEDKLNIGLLLFSWISRSIHEYQSLHLTCNRYSRTVLWSLEI